MLEQKLDELTAAVRQLTAVILQQSVSTLKGHAPDPEVPFDPPESEPSQETMIPAITHDELQAFCLTLVRNKKATKDQIKDIISGFGAEALREVPESDLAQVKAKLEALQ